MFVFSRAIETSSGYFDLGANDVKFSRTIFLNDSRQVSIAAPERARSRFDNVTLEGVKLVFNSLRCI